MNFHYFRNFERNFLRIKHGQGEKEKKAAEDKNSGSSALVGVGRQDSLVGFGFAKCKPHWDRVKILHFIRERFKTKQKGFYSPLKLCKYHTNCD